MRETLLTGIYDFKETPRDFHMPAFLFDKFSNQKLKPRTIQHDRTALEDGAVKPDGFLFLLENLFKPELP